MSERPTEPAGERDRGGARYLLIIEGVRARSVPLPLCGSAVIGRASDALIWLEDPAVSRTHAVLTLTLEELQISDADSRQGTLVNGERLIGPRALRGGDCIRVGDTSIIVEMPARPQPPLVPYPQGAVGPRLIEEVARARRFGRSVAFLLLAFESLEHASAEAAVRRWLRPVDVLFWERGARLLALLPEATPDEAEELARRIVAAPVAPGRAAVIHCPRDGIDVEALLPESHALLDSVAVGAVVHMSHRARPVQVGPHQAILADPKMLHLYELVGRLAQSEVPVLILGETGTGKELVAAALHHLSSRPRRTFVDRNCATLPESLVESELFGHERGAFTGADRSVAGLLEQAHEGTLFLDEVGELPLAVQAKLLRALETRTVRRLGGTRSHEAAFRLVAATNRDLEAEVRAGRFRQDLFYRLNVASLALPPLRERRRDIPLLADAFLQEACRREQRGPMLISPAAMHRLLEHRWPGNIRELRNTMDRAAALCSQRELTPEDLPTTVRDPDADPPGAGPEPPGISLLEEVRALECRRIREALRATGGNIAQTARRLGLSRHTVYERIRQYGIDPDA